MSRLQLAVALPLCAGWLPRPAAGHARHSPVGGSLAAGPKGAQCQAAARFALAAESFSLAANSLPNFFSSKQGMTNENPAVFGGGGLALSNLAETLAEPSPDLDGVASDLHFASCQLEPVELGKRFGDAGDALCDGSVRRAAAHLRAAAHEVDAYGALLRAEDSGDDGAGAQLRDAAAHLRAAAAAMRAMAAG